MTDSETNPLGPAAEPVEKRRCPRHAVDLVFLAMAVPGNELQSRCDQGFGVVLDISDGGIRVATPQPPDRGSRVEVRIAFEEEIFVVQARVKWVAKVRTSTYEVGIEFEPEDVPQLTRLAQLLDLVRDGVRSTVTRADGE